MVFNDKQELSEFKSRIDLRAYAASQGYQVDPKNSWRGTSVMRNPASDDKIIIKRDMDNHYVYFSVRDDNDNGSIIDFIQKRNRGMGLGAVRIELRPWIGKPPVVLPDLPPLPKTAKDRMKVEAAYARMQDAISGHPYLEHERSIPAALLADERFVGRIRIDQRGNAVMPHFDKEGLTGYEIRNTNYKGFASGGSKALWVSQIFPTDNRMVLCESSIDALSHAVLFPDNRTRYASIGGKPSEEQMELVRAAIARMPIDSEIVSAMDADAEGRKLTARVREALELTGRMDLRFSATEPVVGKDFNDELRARPHPLLPYHPEVPSVA